MSEHYEAQIFYDDRDWYDKDGNMIEKNGPPKKTALKVLFEGLGRTLATTYPVSAVVSYTVTDVATDPLQGSFLLAVDIEGK